MIKYLSEKFISIYHITNIHPEQFFYSMIYHSTRISQTYFSNILKYDKTFLNIYYIAAGDSLDFFF